MVSYTGEKMNKILITGGVAGGATAAARARRLDENAEIILIERDEYISFANCGLPYYIGGTIKKRDDLLVTTKEDFMLRYTIDIRNFSEVISIDRENKKVEIRDLKSGKTYDEVYDKLILTPGAVPFLPPVKGVDADAVFTLRNLSDTDRIKAFVDEKKPKAAVIVGAGFIGLEMAENLVHRGINVTIIEKADQVMTSLDSEMASMIHGYLREKKIGLELCDAVAKIEKREESLTVKTAAGKTIECDFVIMSAGIKPENRLAVDAGLETGDNGGIIVNDFMQTSDPSVFAAGDAVETKDFISGMPVMLPLAGPANKQGRIAADNASGRKSAFKGTIGTAVVKLFDLTVAVTGQSESGLKRDKLPYVKSYTQSGSHASYYPGSEVMTIKLLFSDRDGLVLGAQIIGGKGVDKRVDVIATAIKGRLTVYDLEELELAYAPPYSSAKDPVNIAGFVAGNILKGDVETLYPEDLSGLDPSEYLLLDLRTPDELKLSGKIDGALCIPVDELRQRIGELDHTKTYILYCAIGLRGYIAWRILHQKGFKVKNLSGGFFVYNYTVSGLESRRSN